MIEPTRFHRRIPAAVDPITQPSFINGWWYRPQCDDTPGREIKQGSQDWCIINEVWRDDCYGVSAMSFATDRPVVIDVGACIGAFSRRVFDRWPDALVIAVEVNRKNVPTLTLNVPRAYALPMALTYEEGDLALLDTIWADGLSTGGSTVRSRDDVLSVTDPQYVKDLSRVPTVTLEQIVELFDLPRIDCIKMDCEGSEISVIAHSTILPSVGLIVGEYHDGRDELADLCARKLPEHRLETWDHRGNMGLFRLTRAS